MDSSGCGSSSRLAVSARVGLRAGDSPEQSFLQAALRGRWRAQPGFPIEPDGEFGSYVLDELHDLSREQLQAARDSGWTAAPEHDQASGAVSDDAVLGSLLPRERSTA
jgi:hypothetical protein